jgi:hypothetical protein
MHVEPSLEIADDDTEGLTSLLLDVYGPYCAICERPIYEDAHVWDTTTQQLVARGAPATQISRCVLLCVTCAAAQSGVESQELVLPFGGAILWRSTTPRTDLEATTLSYFGLAEVDDLDPRRLAIGVAQAAITEAQGALADRADATQLRTVAALVATTGFLSAWVTAFVDTGQEPLFRDVVGTGQSGARRLGAFFPGTDWTLLYELAGPFSGAGAGAGA